MPSLLGFLAGFLLRLVILPLSAAEPAEPMDAEAKAKPEEEEVSFGPAAAAGAILLLQMFMANFVMAVWTVRMTESTSFRPGGAGNLKEEFEAYGFPTWVWKTVGPLKVTCAVLLVVGLAVPPAAAMGAAGMAVFMCGAVLAHLKVGDPFSKTYPSLSFLCISVLILAAHVQGVDQASAASGLGLLATPDVRIVLCVCSALAAAGMVISAWRSGAYARLGVTGAGAEPLLA